MRKSSGSLALAAALVVLAGAGVFACGRGGRIEPLEVTYYYLPG
jgi:hypothetical protein